jgi:hypothetical protein
LDKSYARFCGGLELRLERGRGIFFRMSLSTPYGEKRMPNWDRLYMVATALVTSFMNRCRFTIDTPQTSVRRFVFEEPNR